MQQVRKCARLTPAERKVYIVCNASNYDEFVVWAKDPKRCGLSGGFPLDHIISNGATSNDSAHLGHVRDLALFAERSGWKDEHVLVLEGDYLVNPDWSMNAAVEHSIIRGADTIGRHALLGKESAGPRHFVDVEASGTVRPRVTGIRVSPGGGASTSSGGGGGGAKSVVGPLYFFRRSTIPLLRAWQADPANAAHPPEAALGHFLAHLVAKVPVYALDLPPVLDVLSLRDVLYAEGLFEFMARRKKELLSLTRVSDTDSSLDFKTEFSGNMQTKLHAHGAREKGVESLVRVEEEEDDKGDTKSRRGGESVKSGRKGGSEWGHSRIFGDDDDDDDGDGDGGRTMNNK